ncbi:hypothetical protein AAT19DRAFT_12374 [Rhodotorula toruloides]|uniref:Uncharacterized protein n=1 Tax=Rhodotorula toruloides TaxID=5286 RepID=A0A2T0AG31_RHOTO|nr:hypothetical protein AAT19DRAFT_12374 [Rhodotorula toruloides]
MSATFDTPARSTAKLPEAPAAAHVEQEPAVASPSNSNEQAKEDEEVEGEKSDHDQEEQKSAGIFPCVSEEREGGFHAVSLISGIPLCSPYPSEEQIRRRYEEEAELGLRR